MEEARSNAETALQLLKNPSNDSEFHARGVAQQELGNYDLAIVDFDSLNQTPYYNLYSHLVYATKAADVRSVIIEGRLVMLDRRLLTLNESVIKKDANAYREKIINSLRN